MRLISHCLTPEKRLSAILSLIRFSNLSAPSQFSALPAVIYFKASPKAISERTSYLRVRLEFLRYPHLIRYHFNGSRFGPPWSFTSTSTCTWLGHPVSGRVPLTSYAHLRLAFATTSPRIQRSPTMHKCIPSFGVQFSPVKFSAQGHSTSELLRTL